MTRWKPKEARRQAATQGIAPRPLGKEDSSAGADAFTRGPCRVMGFRGDADGGCNGLGWDGDRNTRAIPPCNNERAMQAARNISEAGDGAQERK